MQPRIPARPSRPGAGRFPTRGYRIPLVVAAIVAVSHWQSGVLPARAVEPAPDSTLFARTDSIFATWNRSDSPGCALGVVRDGRLVFARGYGMAHLEHGVPITRDTVFDLGSVGKQFTAFCVQLLIRDGRLGLEDDIRKHVPELPDYGATIRIRHLLHHTSGIRDYNELLFLAGHRYEDVTTKEMALDIIVRQRALNFPPGQQFLYSNSGYFLLSVIVERVSGQSLRDFAAERIFGPLGMARTQFNDRFHRIIPGRAIGYEPNDSGFQISMSQWEQTGDGAVLSTLEDLARWDANFYRPVAGDDSVLVAMHAVEPLAGGGGNSYASGLDISLWRGLRCVRHNGAWAGYRSDFVRFPDQRTSFICLTNLGTVNPSGLNDAVAALWLAADLERAAGSPAEPAPSSAPDPTVGLAGLPTVELSPAEIRRVVGRYRSVERGTLTVVFEEGALWTEAPTIRRSTLRPVAPGRFERVGGVLPTLVEFELADTAHAAGVTFRFRNGSVTRFEALMPWEPTAAEIAGMLGRYRSAELNVVVELVKTADGLRLRHPAAGDAPLEVVMPGHFEVLGGEIVLNRRKGRTLGFEFNTGRMRGLTFTRHTGP